MLQYILECIGFQLVFLMVYDLFLRKETFFQWNRFYLLGTHLVSLFLPWIKIEALKTELPVNYGFYPEYLWDSQQNALSVTNGTSLNFLFTWQESLLLLGATIAMFMFSYKMYRLYLLRKNGSVKYFTNFTQIIISNSSVAFSFLKSIFLGDQVLQNEPEKIIQHELVHIKQRHTLDLLFFELLRIVSWFNPLVYVYQNRVSELHEFIADAHVAKNNRKEQYQLMLSQVFQTQKISFVNQFFKSSLIKKRIVMLQKTKSKRIWKLKYLLLLPLVVGMLFYTSCEQENKEDKHGPLLKAQNEKELDSMNYFITDELLDKHYRLITKRKKLIETLDKNDPQIIELEEELRVLIKDIPLGGTEVLPFFIIQDVPVFPGCENVEDKRKCFNEKMRKHIMKFFNYPNEAQEKGIQGRVGINFIINKQGYVSNIETNGPSNLLEEEASRIINKLPKMKPGKQAGDVFGVSYSIPITFKLQDRILEDKNLDSKSMVPFAIADEAPIFPGCEESEDARACFHESIQAHISKHFNYPEQAQKEGIQGRVNVMFTIDNNGNIVNIRKRGPHQLLEDEAVRIMKELPKMKPGFHKGKSVNVPFSIPISFKLQ